MKNKKIAFLFPGQGAQYPGIGYDFYKEFDEAKEVFQEADRILGSAFSELIFKGSLEELTLTKNSQLAIFITSIAILRVLQKRLPRCTAFAAAGLSLGEYTALVAAEKLSFEEALLLVKARGLLMQSACEQRPGGMHVVLGLEPTLIKECLAQENDVWVANINCPGQVVIAGTKEGLEKASGLLKEKGARRVMPLEVSGAFHSGLMESAQEGLKELINQTNIKDSSIFVTMNMCGQSLSEPNEIRKAMIAQVTEPVYWQKGIEHLVKEKQIDLFIEMGPGKTLNGMNKRIGIEVPTISLEKVEDFNTFIKQFEEMHDAITTSR